MHCVDEWSSLSSAELSGRDGESCIAAFTSCWLTRYGIPKVLRTDQERGFFGDQFMDYCK